MSLIHQTDPEFPAAIFHWGCYLLALVERLTTNFDLPFTHDVVLDLFAYGQMHGFIDVQCTIGDSQMLCDHVVGKNKVRWKGRYPPGYFCADDELEIVCYHKDGASFNHYCSGNGKGIVLYDPWSEFGSDSVLNGNVIGKRVYKVV